MGRTPDGKGYAFGDEGGAVHRFEDPAGKTELALKAPLYMIGHEVNKIEWVQWANENKGKIIAVGNGTGSSKHAAVLGARAGTAAGDIVGSSAPLLASAVDAPADANAPVKLYSAGEVGELFCHAGTPFKADTGKTIDKLGCYVNGMAYSGEAKVLLVVTGDKSIVAYSGEDQSKLATKAAAHGRGIYDVAWATADTFLTCSADNLIKVWKWDAAAKSIEEVEKIEQVPGQKEDMSMMLLALATHGGRTAALNLQNQIILREQDGAQQVLHGHAGLLTAIAALGNNVLYASEHRVFSVDATASRYTVKPVQGLTTKLVVDQLAANSSAVFAGSFDKSFVKIEGDAASGFAVTKSATLTSKAIDIACDDNSVFVLQHAGEITELSAADLSVKKSQKPAFTPTSIGWSAATGELWAGDGDGKIHFLKGADFSEVGVEQGHSAGRAVTCIASTSDGKSLVSGDSYRKLNFWDAAGKAKTGSSGEQIDRILSCAYSPDGTTVVSVSTDRSLLVTNAQDPSKCKKVPIAHLACPPKGAVVAANG